jgi:vacuolar-type H+-ATPase subunit H
LHNSQTNNEAKEEPEKKKQKLVKSKKDKQKGGGSKIKAMGKKETKKIIATKIMEKPQPDSKVQIFGQFNWNFKCEL